MAVRQKWHEEHRDFQVGDIVVIQEDRPNRGSWKMAEIIKIEPSTDGHVRETCR